MLNINLKKYGIWWYERGWNKPKWKTSMMSMDAIHVHAKEGGQHGKLGATLPWDKWLLMKVGAMLPPTPSPPQHWIDESKKDEESEVVEVRTVWWILKKFLMGGKQTRKKANKPWENEGIGWSRLKGMGIMARWIEVGAHLGIGVKMITSSPLGAC